VFSGCRRLPIPLLILLLEIVHRLELKAERKADKNWWKISSE